MDSTPSELLTFVSKTLIITGPAQQFFKCGGRWIQMRVGKPRREWYETVSKAVDIDLAVVRMLTLTDFVYERKKKRIVTTTAEKLIAVCFPLFKKLHEIPVA